MGRDIKFRAWDDDFKEMEYIGMNGILDNSVIFERASRSSYIPMQYTGLKDKNGVEIYEGDIIKHDLWKIPVKVFWEYGGFMAQSVTGELGKKSYTDGTLYDMQLPKCKVIGNIYENPELLGEET